MNFKKLQIYLYYLVQKLFGQQDTLGIEIKKAKDLIGRKVNKPFDLIKLGRPFDGYSLYGGSIFKVADFCLDDEFKFRIAERKESEVFVYVEWVADYSNLKIINEHNTGEYEKLPTNVTIEHIDDLVILPNKSYMIINIPGFLLVCFYFVMMAIAAITIIYELFI